MSGFNYSALFTTPKSRRQQQRDADPEYAARKQTDQHYRSKQQRKRDAYRERINKLNMDYFQLLFTAVRSTGEIEHIQAARLLILTSPAAFQEFVITYVQKNIGVCADLADKFADIETKLEQDVRDIQSETPLLNDDAIDIVISEDLGGKSESGVAVLIPEDAITEVDTSIDEVVITSNIEEQSASSEQAPPAESVESIEDTGRHPTFQDSMCVVDDSGFETSKKIADVDIKCNEICSDDLPGQLCPSIALVNDVEELKVLPQSSICFTTSEDVFCSREFGLKIAIRRPNEVNRHRIYLKRRKHKKLEFVCFTEKSVKQFVRVYCLAKHSYVVVSPEVCAALRRFRSVNGRARFPHPGETCGSQLLMHLRNEHLNKRRVAREHAYAVPH